MKARVKIFTYGCQMNDLDSLKIHTEFSRRGFTATGYTREADVIVINTCSVRQKAYEKAMSNLGRLSALKRARPSLVIAVTGCVAQQDREGLLRRMPHVDLVVGTHQLHLLPDLVQDALKGARGRVVAEFSTCIPFMDTIPDTTLSAEPHRAYVTVMQGCDNFCSYCIVPHVRGPEISRRAESVIGEIRAHASQGVREVFLLGQNVNSYRGGMSFPELLRAIHSIDGIERIRFTTSHPKDANDDLVACFRDLPKLCSHIHLPFQSGSDRVLVAMNRHYTREWYLELIERFREARPDIAFSADVMVGFPGETEQDFMETMDVIERVRFDVLYSFKYSVRPMTAAASLADDVPAREKSRRLVVLQARQREITLENNMRRVGSTYDVLVDGASTRVEGQVKGRTTHNAIVNFTGERSLVGRTVRVTVTRAQQNSLTGVLSDAA